MMIEYEKNNDLLEDMDEVVEQLNITGGGQKLTDQIVDTLLDMRETGLLNEYV